jgi:penicillin V acylase-like amidase (Ntn superfamily)
MSEATRIGLEVQLAILREQHNTLASVEEMCSGTVVKVKRYAPLLRRVSKWKAGLRTEMWALERRIETNSPDSRKVSDA